LKNALAAFVLSPSGQISLLGRHWQIPTDFSIVTVIGGKIMETESSGREQYEHILAQAAQLDRAMQINLLLDLAAQMRRSPETESAAGPGLRGGGRKDFGQICDEGKAFAELMTFHRGRRLNGLTLKDLMIEGRR
jgi:hypothetical protein